MTLQVKKNLQIVALVITIVGGIVGGWLTLDNTFAREKQTIETFNQIQQQIQQYRVESTEDRLHNTILNLTQRKYLIRDQLRKYPNDKDLEQEYIEVSEELKRAKDKLDKLEAK